MSDEEELRQTFEQATLDSPPPANSSSDAAAEAKPKACNDGAAEAMGIKPADNTLSLWSAGTVDPFDAKAESFAFKDVSLSNMPDPLPPLITGTTFDAHAANGFGFAEAIKDVSLSNQDIQDILGALGADESSNQRDEAKDDTNENADLW